MTTVNKTAESLNKGIANMMVGAKEDYIKWTSDMYVGEVKSDYFQKSVDAWDSKTQIKEGPKYIKIVQDNSAFAFVCKTDFKHFKKGDILKAASYNAPALNQPRGNVLEGNYPIQWTGPVYLK